MWREFVELAEKQEEPFVALCARFGVSRKTGYKWLKRFRAEGQAGLQPQSRRPKSSPRKIPDAVVAEVLAISGDQPDWSVARIRQEIEMRGVQPLPAASTINLILRRQQMAFVAQQRTKDSEARRHEPNSRWEFRLAPDVAFSDGAVAVPASVRDEATGFILGAVLLDSRREDALLPFAEELFHRHGLPWCVALVRDKTLQHEPACRAHSALTVWLMRLGITVEFVFEPPADPTAGARRRLVTHLAGLAPYQSASLAERWPTADPLEQFAAATGRLTRAQAAVLLGQLREQHNFGGRQEAMQRRGPVSLYRLSPRRLPGKVPVPVYRSEAVARLVSEKGIFTFQRRLVHVGRIFASLCVELKETPAPSRFIVLFADQGLGLVDLAGVPVDAKTSLPLSAI